LILGSFSLKFYKSLLTIICVCYTPHLFASQPGLFAQLLDAFFGKEKTSSTSKKNKQTQAFKGEIVTFTVETCNDGDTCRGTFLANGELEKIKVRLVGIDAPEFSKGGLPEQPMAQDCKASLNNAIQGEKVSLKIYDTDMYQRALGEITYKEKNINLSLLKEGCAEVYRGRPPKGLDEEAYLAAENYARGSRLGVWATQKYESPKDYRKRAKE
jgi:endonuclease YncB( thermonuclease family)